MRNETFTGARGHVAWIFALAFSTAAIIHLERSGFASLTNGGPVDPELTAQARDLLARAEARHQAAPGDPQAAAALLVALVAATEAGALDKAQARSRAALVATPDGAESADWKAARLLAALSFRR